LTKPGNVAQNPVVSAILDITIAIGHNLNRRDTVHSVTGKRGVMKKIALAILLFLSAHAWAGENPNPGEYNANVHVSSSSIGSIGRQDLNVVIDGKKYELLCDHSTYMVLALGDYKAKLVTDEHKTTYDSVQVYEFLFADKKTRKFEVIGQTE
jgi:hypothetical protein